VVGAAGRGRAGAACDPFSSERAREGVTRVDAENHTAASTLLGPLPATHAGHARHPGHAAAGTHLLHHLLGVDETVDELVDGSNSTTATVILAYTQALMARRSGTTAFFSHPKILFNPSQRSTSFLVPGLLAIITMFMTILLPSLAVVREKERGTIEILRAGPIRPTAFIIGKLLPYGLICIFDLLAVVIVGALVFGVTMQGSFLLMVLLSLPFLLAGLALGLLISTFVDSLQVAMYVAFLASILPTILLSGFVFPVSSMPRAVQLVADLVPARYFLTMLRAIYMKGAGLDAVLQPLLVILLFATVLVGTSVERLRRSL